MANPVIDRVEIIPATIPPGGQARITIFAHDDDNALVRLSGTVTDSQGNSLPISGMVTIGDALTYRMSQPAVGTIQQDPDQPNVFIYTAPL